MDEGIDVVDSLLDNYINIIDIKASSRDIRSHKNRFRSGPSELLQNPESLILVQVTL